MKKLLVLFALLGTMACNPLDDVRSDCREAADNALDQCISFYEDEAIPEIRAQINETIAALQAWFDAQVDELRAEFEQALRDKEQELMLRLGCVPDSTLAGWDCTYTSVCH